MKKLMTEVREIEQMMMYHMNFPLPLAEPGDEPPAIEFEFLFELNRLKLSFLFT